MPPSPSNYLRVLSDAFTPVRDTSGRLLGCIPRVSDDALFVGPCPLMFAAQVCVCVDDLRHIHSLPGFVPLDDTDTDLALPAAPADNTDLAEGV